MDQLNSCHAKSTLIQRIKLFYLVIIPINIIFQNMIGPTKRVKQNYLAYLKAQISVFFFKNFLSLMQNSKTSNSVYLKSNFMQIYMLKYFLSQNNSNVLLVF